MRKQFSLNQDAGRIAFSPKIAEIVQEKEGFTICEEIVENFHVSGGNAPAAIGRSAERGDPWAGRHAARSVS